MASAQNQRQILKALPQEVVSLALLWVTGKFCSVFCGFSPQILCTYVCMGPCHSACGISVPRLGIEPRP